jgi:hypothetical protein
MQTYDLNPPVLSIKVPQTAHSEHMLLEPEKQALKMQSNHEDSFVLGLSHPALSSYDTSCEILSKMLKQLSTGF